MINSKIIVSIISYKVNNLTPDKCTTLLNIINKKLNSEELINELNILFIDNIYDVTATEEQVNINITSYITQEHAQSIVKKLRMFIDKNLTYVDEEDISATMIKRRVY